MIVFIFWNARSEFKRQSSSIASAVKAVWSLVLRRQAQHGVVLHNILGWQGNKEIIWSCLPLRQGQHWNCIRLFSVFFTPLFGCFQEWRFQDLSVKCVALLDSKWIILSLYWSEILAETCLLPLVLPFSIDEHVSVVRLEHYLTSVIIWLELWFV